MKKTRKIQKKKASTILAADLHIRSDIPVCRADDYRKAQFDKLGFIFQLCKEEGCPLLIAGDIGNTSQWSNWLLEKTISIINKYKIDIICIPGQHDLPKHRLDYWRKSGCGVLHRAQAINLMPALLELFDPAILCNGFDLTPFPYSSPMFARKTFVTNVHVAMSHQMVIENKPLWPGQEISKGSALLKKFPEYSLILTGGNHNPFVAEYQGRLLVNPGSMMRMTSAQINHKPRVYKWYAGTNIAKAVYLPIEKDVVNQVHIKSK